MKMMNSFNRLLCLMTMVYVLSWLVAPPSPAMAAETIAISGKIVSITMEPLAPMKGALEISNFWGKRTTVYVGFKTRYIPQRAPQVGDRVEIECIRVKGRLAATTVQFKNKAKAI